MSRRSLAGMLLSVVKDNSMKKNILLPVLSLLLFASTIRSQSTAPVSTQLTVIRAGALLNGTSEAARKNQLIFVRGNRIEKVVEGSAQIPPDAVVIHLSASTLLPGLIDSHTPHFLWGENAAKAAH